MEELFTKEEITAGNILIADFMGLKKEDETRRGKVVYLLAPASITPCDCDCLLYHKHWDWIMPVIQKIEDIDEGNLDSSCNNNFHFVIGKRHTRVIYDWGTYLLEKVDTKEEFENFNNASKDYRHSIFDYNKISSTWKAVVDFIEWWNEKNK